MILVHFQGKPFNITVIQVCAPATNAEEAEVEWLYEDLQTPSKTNTKKISFSSWGLDCKGKKSRDIWSNRQVWPLSTK